MASKLGGLGGLMKETVHGETFGKKKKKDKKKSLFMMKGKHGGY